MSTSSLTASAAALLAVSLASGCTEPPSYRLRWSVDGNELSRPAQCSNAGIFDVRVRTIDVLGETVDVRSFPCFGEDFADPNDRVPGPSLPPGDYAVEVRGVTRNGVPWQDDAELQRQIVQAELDRVEYETNARFELCRPPLPAGISGEAKATDAFACRPEQLVCDCSSVTVREEAIPELDGFNILAPPECVDGLDNDGDGLVDRQDPACGGGSLDNVEDADISDASFAVQVSFLDNNPNAGCTALAQATGLSRIVIEVDDNVISSASCSNDPLRFVRPLAAGDHIVRVTPQSVGGDPVATPFETTVTVIERVGGSFDIRADFRDEDFFEPIEGLAAFVVNYVGAPDQPVRACAPQDAEHGTLTIETVRLGLRGSHGEPLPTVSLDDGTPLDGSTDIPCPNGTLLTQSLSWGGYVVTAEALSAEGEVCFSNVSAGTPAAPFESFTVRPARVLPPPPSCVDCTTDDDCGDFICDDDGLCVIPCDDDFDCVEGENCTDGRCVESPE